MKYCMNCGAKLEDDAVFCTECGARQEDTNAFEAEAAMEQAAGDHVDDTAASEYKETVPEEPAVSDSGINTSGEAAAPEQPEYVQEAAPVSEYQSPAPQKPFFRSVPGILVIVLGVLIIAGGIVFACVMNSPKVMLARAIKNTSVDIAQIPALKFLGAVAENGSVSATVDMGETLAGYGVDMDGEITVKEYYDIENASTAITGDLKLHGSSAVDGAMWVTPDALIVKSDVLLGKKAYGIGINALQDNLKGSDLGDVIPDDLYDAIDEADEKIFEQPDDCKRILTDYLTDVGEYMTRKILDGAEFEKSSDTVDFAQSTVKASVVTVTIDDKIMREAFDETVKYAEKEEKFKEAREIIENCLEFCQIAAGEADADGEELLEDIFDELDDAADEIDGLEMEYRFYIYRSRLVKLELEESESDYEISFILGPDPADPELFEITLAADGLDLSIGWEVETNTDSDYEAKLYFKGPGRKYSIDLAWNRKDGDFSAKLKNVGSISGTMLKSGDELAVEIDKIKIEDENVDVGVSMLLKEKDKMPAAPKYEEILTMDEDEIEDVIEDVEDSLVELIEEW